MHYFTSWGYAVFYLVRLCNQFLSLQHCCIKDAVVEEPAVAAGWSLAKVNAPCWTEVIGHAPWGMGIIIIIITTLYVDKTKKLYQFQFIIISLQNNKTH